MATYDVTAVGNNVSLTNTYSVGSKSMQRIPGQDKVVISWLSESNITYVQAFSVNKTNGNLSAIGSPLNVGSCGYYSYGVSVCIIDSTNFAIFWNGVGDDGFCQLFKLDETGNVSTNGSSLEYDTTNGTYPSSVLMDSTHILNIWSGEGNDGYAQIFTVNTTNGTITKTGSAYEFDTNSYTYGSLQKINATKAIVFYAGLGNDGYARVLSINTSTWAVTGAGSTFEFKDNVENVGNACVLMPNNKIINIYTSIDDKKTSIRSFSINDSTWEITAWGAENNIGTIRTDRESVTLQKVDDTHVIALHQGVNYLSYCRVLTLNTSNGNLEDSANVINLYNLFAEHATSTFFEEKPGLFLFSWSRTGGDFYSRIQSVQVEMPLVAPTVTTQAVSSIDKTTATGNGNITDTGGENATRRGFCYLQGSSGDPTTANSVVYDDGSFGTGAYTKAITGLTPNTTYRVRAYAVNSAGTSYGSTVSFTTLKADESNFLLFM